jgi:hypothetical protein
MDNVEQADKVVRELTEKLEALTSRTRLLADQRQKISYAANVGDKQAKAKLTEIIAETSTHGFNIESVQFALREANDRLVIARQAAASAADCDKANQIAALNAKLKEELDNADDAFSDAIASVLGARALLMEIHTLGVSSPTDQMFRINSVAVIKTALQNLPQPWISDFEFSRLAPSQKKAFRPLAESWCDQIANQIAARLGEEKKKDAA